MLLKALGEGLDKGGDGGFGGFEVGSVAEVAEGLAGDGAYGGKDDVGGRVRLAASRRAKRLRAVEALVKVMASG